MLHILLLILKIVGIILAVILGILLLLIGIVLFVPICYEVSAKCDGTIESLRAKAKVTWLLHLVRADAFVKGTKLKWQIRAAWIKKSSAMSLGERKEGQDDEEKSKTNESDKKIQKVKKTDSENEVSEKTNEVIENIEEKHEECRLEGNHDESEEADTQASGESEKTSIGDKINKIIRKIKTSIQNICDKVKDLLQKKEKITEFLTEESHVRAFKKVKKALFVLLKRLKPDKLTMKLHFGFEDPSTTGKVLAGLSILYPFLGDTTEIIPDFQQQVLDGKANLKGKLRISHFVWLALKLFLSKDVRKSYKDIRNFKL